MNIYKSTLILVSIISIFSFSLFTAVPTAHACSCIELGSPQEMLAESSAVFSGRVIEINSDSSGYGYKVKFDVDRIWKGTSEKSLVVSTGLGDGDCGFKFEQGEQYIVYAYGDSSLSTGICSRTHLLTKDDADVSALGKWKAPATDNSTNTPSQIPLNAPTIGIVILGLVLVGMVYKIVVSRRKPL